MCRIFFSYRLKQLITFKCVFLVKIKSSSHRWSHMVSVPLDRNRENPYAQRAQVTVNHTQRLQECGGESVQRGGLSLHSTHFSASFLSHRYSGCINPVSKVSRVSLEAGRPRCVGALAQESECLRSHGGSIDN